MPIFLAVGVPILLWAGFSVLIESLPAGASPGSTIGMGTLLAFTAMGFLFLAARWHEQALLIALAYFPLMFFFLFFLGTTISCNMSGDCF